jgi:hypothetical protein
VDHAEDMSHVVEQIVKFSAGILTFYCGGSGTRRNPTLKESSEKARFEFHTLRNLPEEIAGVV